MNTHFNIDALDPETGTCRLIREDSKDQFPVD